MKKSLILLIALICMAATVQAATFEFSWNANTEPDLAGYRLYQSTVKGVYQYGASHAVREIPAGTTTVTHDVLVDGAYFWVVTAYDAAGNESSPSNEVSWTIDTTPPAPPTGFWGRLIKTILGVVRGVSDQSRVVRSAR